MATKLKAVDVVTVGVGLTGTILAKELADTGLKVVGLERGGWRDTQNDFAMPYAHDELRYARRHELMQDLSRDTLTFRNAVGDTALPMRYMGSFLPGEGVGGAAVHWNGVTWRFLPWDFETRSRTLARYGAGQLGEDCTSQDWGVTYDELEPHFDRFEHLYGICGKAGNLKGKIVEGGNPFEGPRARDYPNPPMKTSHVGALYAKAAKELGYHPFPAPSANMTRPYTNPYGLTLGACVYCGYCERFGCEMGAKASPQTTVLPVLMKNPNYELRTLARVIKVNLDSEKKRAVSVTYVDSRGREFEQPADLILLTSYVFSNVRLMLLSGIGKPYDPVANTGVVGRNYAYQTNGNVTAFFEDKIFNQFMGAGALSMMIDDFDGDNFDHGGLDRRRERGRTADRLPARAAGHPALGIGVEEGDGALLQPRLRHHHPRGLPELPRQLPRPRPDLPRRLRAAAAAHDLRLPSERIQDVGLHHQEGRRDRQGRGCREDERHPAHRQVQHRALPEHAQHGRRRDGRGPEDERGEPFSSELGRAERVCRRR